MKVISILTQKGGAGKTTVALNLAVEAERNGKKTAVFDLDPQATATFWKDIRECDTPAVISLQAVRLEPMLKAAKSEGTDFVFIDGAAVARDIAFSAASVSDYILIPTKTAVFDTKSMIQTIDLAKEKGIPYSILLNMLSPVGQETRDAERLVEQLNSKLCPVRLGNRKSYFRAQGTGLAVQEYEPGGKAAIEIKRLYKFITEQVNNSKKVST